MMLRLSLLVALIGATVALTDWLKDLQEALQRAPDVSSKNTPDYTFQEIMLTVMGIDGAPRYRVEAPRMAHFGVGDSAKLRSPHVWFYRDDGPPVELCSNRAVIEASGKRVWLLGRVDIIRPPYADRARLTVKTRDVTVFPALKIARTKAPVQAASGGDQWLKGVGMVLDLAAGTLDLKSQVRGTYVP
jgi:LPS export ABC transporter protein LptC